ncbi:MAG: alpha-glucan family phosphorylase, partial [Dehalococcoidia bacterium]|nr:alpha-glucan family phosphorylase [Dehalococcoidia bacterium]
MSSLTKLAIQNTSVAYFSMEVGLVSGMPTYSGGLGVLAGDTLRAAADLGLPMVGITLLYRKGYFQQTLDNHGNQIESQVEWSPLEYLKPLPQRSMVEIEGRHVQLRPWLFTIRGVTSHEVPVYFLDTNLPDNNPVDQTITDYLYGGDIRYRLCQETVLGLGGISMLRALGYADIETYHMNEGHSSLMALALLEERTQRKRLLDATEEDQEAIRQQCVFTTHTPVPAGHDKFPKELVRQVLGQERTAGLEATGCFLENTLNMTHLGLISSRYIN